MKTQLLILLGIVLTVASCKKESDPTSASNTPITSSSELEPYISNFRTQGNLRGLNIPADLNGITYEIKELEENGVAGVCYWSSANPNHIVINSIYWNRFTTDQKEAVLFHELGHCYLDKQHNDASLANGNCESLMHSGTLQNCQHAYSGANKTYYLNELFGSEIPN